MNEFFYYMFNGPINWKEMSVFLKVDFFFFIICLIVLLQGAMFAVLWFIWMEGMDEIFYDPWLR